MQLTFFQKRKSYLKISDTYIDISTGEVFTELPSMRAVIIYDTHGRTYRESRVKPADRFKYKMKSGLWVSTKEPNTSYLGVVLEDKYGKAVTLTIADNIALCYLGGKKEVIRAKNKEELNEKIDHFYQGIDYKKIPFEKAYGEVFKTEDYGKLVLVGGILIFLFFAYMMLAPGDEEVIEQTDTAVLQDITAPPPQEKPEEITNGFLEALYGLALKGNYQFVANVDFNRNAVVVYSLIPDAGFRKVGDVFQKVVELDITPVKPTKGFAKCVWVVKKYDISRVEQDSVSVEIHDQLPVEEVNTLLKKLKGCPVEIRGVIKFADLLHRQVDISLTLKGG